MSTERKTESLALKGGLKAVSTLEDRGEPKIGIEEFMSIVDRFGFPKKVQKKIRSVVENAEIGEGPFLANYYSGLKESKVQAYERVAKKVFNAKYSTGTSSGTGALHAAFVAAGVGPGTEVICPAIGFFATAAAVVMAKGVPIFCDVDTSLGMDPTKIEPLINKRTIAIAPTHVMGSVCDMKPIMRIAKRNGLKVIEDCAQSCGASYRGKPVGTIGDLGCFSISSYKTVGGGEGGLLLTNKKRLWERASHLVECGGLWRPDRFAPPRYKNEIFCGTNYRMSELEAAVDVIQLKKVKAVARRFRSVRQRILKQLRRYGEIVPQKINDMDGELGYLMRFFPESPSLSEKIAEALHAEGIVCTTRGKNAPPDWHIYSYMYPLLSKGSSDNSGCPFDCPVYVEKGGKAKYTRGDCPVADDLFDRVINIPLNQWYTAGDCRKIANGINKVLSAYCAEDDSGLSWT